MPNMPGTGDGQAVERNADVIGSFRKLFDYIGALKVSVIVACALSLVGAVLNLIGPSKLGDMTNLISAGLTGAVDLGQVGRIGILLVVLYALGFACNYIQGFIMATVTQRVSQSLRRDISEKIDRLPLRYLDSTPTGDVLSRVTNDVDTASTTMNQSLSTIVSSVATLIGSVVMMLATNWIMTVAALVATLLGVALMSIVIVKSQPYFTQQQQVLGTIDAEVEETYGGLDVVKTCNGEAGARETFHASNDEYCHANQRATFLSSLMMPLMIFIGNLAYVVVCVVGAVLALQGIISFGVIVSFMIYVRLFTQPLQNISQAATSVQSMAAALGRVFEFLGEDEVEDESAKTKQLGAIEGRVTFHHVNFGYEPNRTIIHDFTATTMPGQKVAIVGPTGAGKTTMVNLLERFYEVDAGRITIDGNSIEELTRTDVRDHIGMVLQDTWLFEGTLRENIAFDTEGVTDERLDQVCEACGLLGYVNSLPKRYDTVITDESSLSVGQRQLITIARAMVKDAPLLILDEATSSVDTRTERKVQKAMDTLMRGRTSFVIAHRLSTIRDADTILVMEHGDIIEKGTHDELLAKGGAYAKLYDSQFEG